jgi:hypothetical protein
MLLFWSMTTIVGIKIKGIYLSYCLFWIVFFVPAIIHYELPKKLLRKMLPLLEQLDHSMKYERRSILDKSELLVDVKLPTSELNDEEEEDQYLESFKLDENQRILFERLGENADEEDTDGEEEDLVDQNNIDVEFDDQEEIEQKQQTKQKSQNKQSHRINEVDYSDEDDSMLPDDTMPSLSEVLDSTQIESGDRAIRASNRKSKNRPSVLKYYENYFGNNNYNNSDNSSLSNNESINSTSPTTRFRKPNSYYQNEPHDIDETFDFLDEELKKY